MGKLQANVSNGFWALRALRRDSLLRLALYKSLTYLLNDCYSLCNVYI